MASAQTKSSRLVLPYGVASSGGEPANAAVGTLSYDPDTDTARVKKASGWDDLVGGGGGTITDVIAGAGLTGGGSSGAVTIDADFGTSAGTIAEGNDARFIALASAAPADVTRTAAAAGVGITAARADHKHDVSVAAPSTLVVGGSNAAGSASSLARSDHVHALPAFGTTAGTFAQGNDSRFGAGLTSTGNPLIDLPASTVTADSDEFTADTLLSGAWTMWNDTDSVAMSRLGNINWYANTLTGTQFNSEIRGSTLFVQVPYGKVCLMGRTISTGAGMFVVRTTRNMSVMNWGSSTGPVNQFIILANKSGNTYDKNNFVWIGINAGVPASQRRNTLAGVTTNDTDVSNVGPNYDEMDTYAVRLDGSAGNIAFMAKSSTGSVLGFPNRSGVFTANWLTIYMAANTTSGTPPVQQTIFGFDYVRRYPSTAFIWG